MRQRHILLSVTGMSPQVVTETLYAIHRDKRPWPEDIWVITTAKGANQLRAGLIAHGNLERLCRDYDRPIPNFSDGNILVVPDSEGNQVEDARTLPDHEALADFITRTVLELTSRVDADGFKPCLHASLAGGRKTMTFYLGYAMSLFARPDDCLSHVLVDQAYEGEPDFYYPTPYFQEFISRSGDRLNAADAAVTLADIPFIRHRDYLPGRFHHFHDGISFRALIDLINLGQTPDRLRITLEDAQQRLLVAGSDGKTVAVVPMTPANYTAYRMVIRLNQANLALLKLPHKDIPDTDLAWSFMEDAFSITGLSFDEHATLTQLIDRLADHNELRPTGIANRTLDSLRVGMRRSFFAERLNEIRVALHEYLPEKLQKLLEVRPLFLNGRKATQAELDNEGINTIKGASYCTMLPAVQFSIKP